MYELYIDVLCILSPELVIDTKINKGDGGAVGFTENPQALERWMIIGPELSRHIQEFEDALRV